MLPTTSPSRRTSAGCRNWDYRYCRLRDATITLEALLRTGYTAEAESWRQWLGRAIAGDPNDVQIMYGVAGERRLAEWEVSWLPGYERSAPVRIGNAAVDQRQLDVYGEVTDALTLGRQAGLQFDKHTWSLQRQLLDFLEKHWHEPDEGIWEVRGRMRQDTSCIPCHGLGQRLRPCDSPGRRGQPVRCSAGRTSGTRFHAQVLEQGYDSERGVFTQYYGSKELDASVLLIPEVGFLPPDDPRVVSMVRVIKRELMRDGLVLRYTQPAKALSTGGRADVDGLPGAEGAFLACSFWLVNALHLIGDHDEAVAIFERLLSLRSDLGLLSEEYDPRYGRQVGNTPQAFSHVLNQSALNLEDHAYHHCRRPGARGWGAPSSTARRPGAVPRHLARLREDHRPGTGRLAVGATLMGSHATPSVHSGRKRPQGPPAGLQDRRLSFGWGPAGACGQAVQRLPSHDRPGGSPERGLCLRP